MTAHGWLIVGLLSLGCAEILGLETPEPRPPEKGGTGGKATGGSSGTEGAGDAGAPGGDGGMAAQGGSGGQGGTVTGGAGGAGTGGSPDCTEGERRCAGETTTTPEICDETGNWIVNDEENGGEDCDVDCDAGRCIECRGTQVQCNGKVPQRCEAGVWENDTPCRHYCRNGACENPLSCMGLDDCPGSTSCCSAFEVPGGTFLRDYDGVIHTDNRFNADLSTFVLDEFEVTVGRFRNFVRAYSSIELREHDGKATHIEADDGWKTSYPLPRTPEELELEVTCTRTTWTADHAVLPMNCVNWYIAYAFCIWDGGRLPTEAEWNRAAAGGNDQRVYPWSDPPYSEVIRSEHAVFGLTDMLPPAVGSKQPTGTGKWGHADLAGSLHEWTLDFFTEPYESTECKDCLAATGADGMRSIRGGSFDISEEYVYASSRLKQLQTVDGYYLGFRCAHDVNLAASPQSASRKTLH